MHDELMSHLTDAITFALVAVVGTVIIRKTSPLARHETENERKKGQARRHQLNLVKRNWSCGLQAVCSRLLSVDHYNSGVIVQVE